MQIWFFVVEFFWQDNLAAALALVIVFLTAAAVSVGYFARSTGLYAALCLLTVSLGNILFLAFDRGEKTLVLLLTVSGSFAGMGYVVLYVLLAVRCKIVRRREARTALKRRIQFTLPDRENEYLRDRLRISLNTKREEVVSERKQVGVRIGYARKMIAKIKEASLTPTERIDVEEMAGLIAVYDSKEKWSASDVKVMSEVFSRLLKLSAKYGIAV